MGVSLLDGFLLTPTETVVRHCVFNFPLASNWYHEPVAIVVDLPIADFRREMEKCSPRTNFFRFSAEMLKAFLSFNIALPGLCVPITEVEKLTFPVLQDLSTKVNSLLVNYLSLSTNDIFGSLGSAVSSALSKLGLRAPNRPVKAAYPFPAALSGKVDKLMRERQNLFASLSLGGDKLLIFRKLRQLQGDLKVALGAFKKFRQSAWHLTLDRIAADVAQNRHSHQTFKSIFSLKRVLERGASPPSNPTKKEVEDLRDFWEDLARHRQVNNLLLLEIKNRRAAASVGDGGLSWPALTADFTEGEVREVFLSMSSWAAAGYDGITIGHWAEFSLTVPGLLTLIKNLFSRILSVGVIPADWKVGLVLPFHKGGKTRLSKDFRPITLLVTLAKAFSRCLFLRLSVALDEAGAFPPMVCGFRPHLGAVDASLLLRLLLEKGKLESSNEQGVCGPMFVSVADVVKSFDVLPHPAIELALLRFGVPLSIVNLINNWLLGRSSRVFSGSVVSKPFSIERGCPQGSTISPFFHTCDMIQLHVVLGLMQLLLKCSRADLPMLTSEACGLIPLAFGRNIPPFEFRLMINSVPLQKRLWSQSGECKEASLPFGVGIPPYGIPVSPSSDFATSLSKLAGVAFPSSGICSSPPLVLNPLHLFANAKLDSRSSEWTLRFIFMGSQNLDYAFALPPAFSTVELVSARVLEGSFPLLVKWPTFATYVGKALLGIIVGLLVGLALGFFNNIKSLSIHCYTSTLAWILLQRWKAGFTSRSLFVFFWKSLRKLEIVVWTLNTSLNLILCGCLLLAL